MHITFNGVLAPYTYNCPYAHKLRNRNRIFPKPREDETPEERSRRQRGIDLHEGASAFIQDPDGIEFEFVTPTMEEVAAAHREGLTIVEEQLFFSADYEPIEKKPIEGDYISIRPDAVIIDDGVLRLFDWKFANKDFGAPRYYDEVSFFVAMLSFKIPGIHLWSAAIHFPEDDYTLPVRTWDVSQINALQSSYMNRIAAILDDHFYFPIPSKARCRFCNYRSADTGGTNDCNSTSI